MVSSSNLPQGWLEVRGMLDGSGTGLREGPIGRTPTMKLEEAKELARH